LSSPGENGFPSDEILAETETQQRRERAMTLQDIVTLYEYNRWANSRALEAAEKLDATAFVKDLKNSFPSVRDTLAHILGAEWIWLRRWHGESPAKLVVASEFATVASLRERFQAVDRERDAFLKSVTEARLQQPFDYKDLAGNALRLPLVQSMQHVVNHGTYHRGQVTTMLRQLGATPIGMDMARFYLERAAGK
jgi:uncharacterized damage-inducible protein DinB